MSMQIPETIIIDNEQYSCLFGFIPDNHPMIEKLDKKVARKENNPSNYIFGTGCYRKYVGTWEIIDDKLYLKDIEGIYKKLSSDNLFADWISGIIEVNFGKVIKTNCINKPNGFLTDKEIHLEIKNGVVISKIISTNE